jgi:3-oxoacyl-[acyl-carrier protein] reductase
MSTRQTVQAGAALVTGASRGIGRVVALRLAAGGYPVAVNYRSRSSEAEAVVREIESLGGRAVALGADIADVQQAGALFDRATDALGQVAVLVNNAGITQDRLAVQMSEDDWNATWSTDLAGPRALMNRARVCMSGAGWGRIVNLSSVVGSVGNAGQSNYAAAKSALLGLTREAAVQCAPSGITVNCVVPGYFATDATAHLNEQQTQAWMRRIPAQRFGSVDDIAELVLFLVGDSASYITGQCIAIDGGFLAASGFGFAS